MKDLYQAISDGDYESKLPYYLKRDTGWDVIKLAVNEAYKADNARLGNQFKIDAFEYVGLTGHNKAQRIWDYAWREGHSYGYQSVLSILEDIAELVK